MDIARASAPLLSLWRRWISPTELPSKLFDRWFPVEASGLSRIPPSGGALLVANHSGLLPLDAALALQTLGALRPGRQRLVGFLERTPLSSIPRRLFPSLDLRVGSPADALEELRRGALVLVFPEGLAAAKQTIWGARELGPFGRGGFIRVALQAAAPIIPLRIDGGQYAFPVLTQVPSLARWLGLPAFPLTPFFPWLGPLGLLPLPAHWSLRLGEPLDLGRYGTGDADDDRILEEISSLLRQSLAALVHSSRPG